MDEDPAGAGRWKARADRAGRRYLQQLFVAQPQQVLPVSLGGPAADVVEPRSVDHCIGEAGRGRVTYCRTVGTRPVTHARLCWEHRQGLRVFVACSVMAEDRVLTGASCAMMKESQQARSAPCIPAVPAVPAVRTCTFYPGVPAVVPSRLTTVWVEPTICLQRNLGTL